MKVFKSRQISVAVAIVVLSVAGIVGAALIAWFGFGLAVDEYTTTLTQNVTTQITEEDVTPVTDAPAITRIDREIVMPDGTMHTFRLADPFNISVAAEGLGKARFMAMSPDRHLFVPDIVDYNLSHQGKLFVLEDFNEETKQFETKHTYLSGLRGPNSVAFYTDTQGNHWLYLALTEHLVRYPYEPGDTEPSGEPEVILEFPNTQAPEARSVVWHITRTIEIRDGRVYISIGSGCNSCEQPDGEMRAMIASVTPEGADLRVHATGLRNSVGFTWADDTLYATENGVDHLGTDRPNEVFYRITDGEHYGWPYCYELNGELLRDTTADWEDPMDCAEVPHSLAAFPPRSAPLGVAYFADAPEIIDNTFLIALHGSFDASLLRRPRIMRVTGDGDTEVFMEGFQENTAERYGRPVDFLQYDADSFFFTDDQNGRIYYVYAN